MTSFSSLEGIIFLMPDMVVCLQHTSMKEAKSSWSGKPAPSSLYAGICLKIKDYSKQSNINFNSSARINSIQFLNFFYSQNVNEPWVSFLNL